MPLEVIETWKNRLHRLWHLANRLLNCLAPCCNALPNRLLLTPLWESASEWTGTGNNIILDCKPVAHHSEMLFGVILCNSRSFEEHSMTKASLNVLVWLCHSGDHIQACSGCPEALFPSLAVNRRDTFLEPIIARKTTTFEPWNEHKCPALLLTRRYMITEDVLPLPVSSAWWMDVI